MHRMIYTLQFSSSEFVSQTIMQLAEIEGVSRVEIM